MFPTVNFEIFIKLNFNPEMPVGKITYRDYKHYRLSGPVQQIWNFTLIFDSGFEARFIIS